MKLKFGKRKIIKHSNALTVVLPSLFVKNHNLKGGDIIEVYATDGKLVIEVKND